MHASHPTASELKPGLRTVNASKVVALPVRAAIEGEAAEWVVRFNDPMLSHDTLQAFRDWEQTSSVRKAAFDRILRLWDGLSVVGEFEDHAANVIVTRAVEDDRVFAQRELFRRALLLGMLLTAALAFCAMLITFVADVLLPHEPYRNGRGEAVAPIDPFEDLR